MYFGDSLRMLGCVTPLGFPTPELCEVLCFTGTWGHWQIAFALVCWQFLSFMKYLPAKKGRTYILFRKYIYTLEGL